MPQGRRESLEEPEGRTLKDGGSLNRPTISSRPLAAPQAPEFVSTPPAGSPAGTPPDQVSRPVGDEPRAVGKYFLAEKLGVGGMGVVYKAHDPDLHRDIALKMIRAGAFAHPTDVTRFLKESQALAQLRHPNIIAIHDAGEEGGQPFFVMEYLPGGSLFTQRQRFQKDPDAAVALVEKVARATAFLHCHNMLHRDLKPGNILLDVRGEPYLADFGLVKWLDGGADLTRSHQRVGTPSYMAPEQTGLVDLPLGPWTDVWALGVILYELLAGRRPFDANSKLISREICEVDPPAPRQLNSALDRGLESVVVKCLQKDPARRFGSANELADELLRWLRKEPLATRSPGRVQRLRTWGRRRPWTVAAVLLLLLAAVATPAYVIVTDPERPLRGLSHDLAQGTPVTLIGETGAPQWSRWATTETGTATVGADGCFSVSAANAHVLLELLPAVPLEAYRLRGQIRHQSHATTGGVGVFACASSVPTPHGKAHFSVVLGFDDVSSVDERLKARPAPPPKLSGNPALSLVSGLADMGRRGDPWTGGFGNKRVAAFQPDQLGKRWRHIAITVTSQQVQMSFDGQESAPRPWEELQQELAGGAKRTFDFDPKGFAFLAAPPILRPRGQLGVFVRNGSAAFANFVLEPMAPK